MRYIIPSENRNVFFLDCGRIFIRDELLGKAFLKCHSVLTSIFEWVWGNMFFVEWKSEENEKKQTFM